jgi:hypothetical protein
VSAIGKWVTTLKRKEEVAQRVRGPDTGMAAAPEERLLLFEGKSPMDSTGVAAAHFDNF